MSQLGNMQTVKIEPVTTTTVQGSRDMSRSMESFLAASLGTQQYSADLRGEAEDKRDTTSQHTAMLNQIRIGLDSLQELLRVHPWEKVLHKYVTHKSRSDQEKASQGDGEGALAWLLEGKDDDSSNGDKQLSEESRREERHIVTAELIAWLQHGGGLSHLSHLCCRSVKYCKRSEGVGFVRCRRRGLALLPLQLYRNVFRRGGICGGLKIPKEDLVLQGILELIYDRS